ncbi:MAG TPA: S8 family serine peptidase [Propionibacteriaceae bacterium]|nr:S8 family serine peptidase [Propionibacteriaceae bacterium]
MRVDSARQIRVVVLPKSARSNVEISKIVKKRLGDGWLVRRLTRGSPLVLLTGESEHTVGTTGHARESHEAALALYRSKRFRRAEADVPVPVDVDLAADSFEAVADNLRVDNPPPLDWVHQILHWPEAIAAMPSASRGGVGISVGQPDSGYTIHPNLGAAGLDLNRDRDVIDSDDDALDDLVPNPLWPFPNPGHGTATASVIVGQGTATEGIVGLAGRSLLVPIRATESVVQVFDSDVAKAVAHARQVGCHVVTMSLGGKGFVGLKREIQRAVDAGMIVMAAAGNYVDIVTAPASYDNCLAVAATGPGDTLWPESSRGTAVDVSMPGACVYVAGYHDKTPIVRMANGTSYAVAHLAAAAALWLAHHGRQFLINKYGARLLQAAFLTTVRWPGVCVVPPGWDPGYGVGRVDLPALLTAPLPEPADLSSVAAFGAREDDAVARIAAMISADPVRMRTRLAQLLKVSSHEELNETIAEHEGELVYLALADRTFAQSLARPDSPTTFRAEINVAGVSDDLGARLAG